MIKIDDAVLVVVDDKTDSDLAGDVLLPQVGRGNFKLDTRRLEVVTVGDIYGASLPAVSDFSPDLQLVEFHLPLQKKNRTNASQTRIAVGDSKWKVSSIYQFKNPSQIATVDKVWQGIHYIVG